MAAITVGAPRRPGSRRAGELDGSGARGRRDPGAGELATQYEAAIADPDLVARTTALANRFKAHTGVAENDPAVHQVAAEIAALGLALTSRSRTAAR